MLLVNSNSAWLGKHAIEMATHLLYFHIFEKKINKQHDTFNLFGSDK